MPDTRVTLNACSSKLFQKIRLYLCRILLLLKRKNKHIYMKGEFVTFHLDLVAKYIGIATATPSGMLWKAMAIAMETPSFKLRDAVRKTAIPSGKLWRVNPKASKIPDRRALFLNLDLSLDFAAGSSTSLGVEKSSFVSGSVFHTST